MNDLFSLASHAEVTDSLTLAVSIVLGYFFILWAALVVWVARDVIGRTRHLGFHVAALSLVIFLNVFGLVVYLIIRPQKTLAERYYEDLEQHALDGADDVCACGATVHAEFRYCPSCGAEAHRPCPQCKRLTSPSWQHCAHCNASLQSNTSTKKTKK